MNFFKKLIAIDGVEKIVLFGSRARGDSQDRADIDLAISCSDLGVKEWQEILDIIDNADTLLKIDCIKFDDLNENSDLKKAIIQQGIVLYERL